MTRDGYHKLLDDALTHAGFSDTAEVKWGSVVIEVKFEAGQEVIRIKERETQKPNRGNQHD